VNALYEYFVLLRPEGYQGRSPWLVSLSWAQGVAGWNSANALPVSKTLRNFCS